MHPERRWRLSATADTSRCVLRLIPHPLDPRIERVWERVFEGEESILHLIERIVGPLGLRVDQASPWVDARLPGGSRVQTRFLST